MNAYNESDLRADLGRLSRSQVEDGVRLGIGMCVQLIDVSIEQMTGRASQAQLDALAGVRDAMREMSAEFTLNTGAGQ